MNSGNSKKRSAHSMAVTLPPQPPKKHHAAMEEEDLDEDVFLEETLLECEVDSQVLRELEERNALKERLRLQKWKRPALSQAYLFQTQSISFQRLEIDYIIGESHKELLPNSSGPAAIIRIFGVTKEVALEQPAITAKEGRPNFIADPWLMAMDTMSRMPRLSPSGYAMH